LRRGVSEAARPFWGKGRWLTGYDLCNLTSGATEFFEHIGADTIQRICMEYAQKRKQAKRVRLKWRKSFGSHRSLGWLPFKAASLRRHGRYVTFCGKSIRFFETARFAQISHWQQGCFAQNALGEWYLCLPVQVRPDESSPSSQREVGIDLGLKDTAVTSDGERLVAGQYYRGLETKIAQAQRQGHRRQAKRLHLRASRRRLNATHVFTKGIVRK